MCLQALEKFGEGGSGSGGPSEDMGNIVSVIDTETHNRECFSQFPLSVADSVLVCSALLCTAVFGGKALDRDERRALTDTLLGLAAVAPEPYSAVKRALCLLFVPVRLTITPYCDWPCSWQPAVAGAFCGRLLAARASACGPLEPVSSFINASSPSARLSCSRSLLLDVVAGR